MMRPNFEIFLVDAINLRVAQFVDMLKELSDMKVSAAALPECTGTVSHSEGVACAESWENGNSLLRQRGCFLVKNAKCIVT